MAHTTGKTYAELGSMTSLRNQLTQDLYKEYSNQSANTLLEFYGNYNKDFGSHHLDVMAGYSWQHYFERYLSYRLSERRPHHDLQRSSQQPQGVLPDFVLRTCQLLLRLPLPADLLAARRCFFTLLQRQPLGLVPVSGLGLEHCRRKLHPRQQRHTLLQLEAAPRLGVRRVSRI